jgi:hypothetical protein
LFDEKSLKISYFCAIKLAIFEKSAVTVRTDGKAHVNDQQQQQLNFFFRRIEICNAKTAQFKNV